MVASGWRDPRGGRRALVIANTGEIDAETASHLFDRFWHRDKARSRDAGGSGLGLAITRQIVRLHHGEIHVEPAVGETWFVIGLPYRDRLRQNAKIAGACYTLACVSQVATCPIVE
ncbi:MAG: ATP-binding protein [Candidatus Nanopelagicales bacterium]